MREPKFAENEPLSVIVEFLEKADKDDLASQLLDVFAECSDSAEQFNVLAKLYLDVRNAEKAEKYALKVYNMVDEEAKYNCRGNLAKMYNNLNEPAKSLPYSLENLKQTPNSPDTKLEIVFSKYLLGDKAEAEVILREMKANEHFLSERHQNIVNFNLGTYDMEAGHFLKGLGGFLINVKKLELWFSPKELPYKYWQGGLYPGRTLILFMEGGGIGDEFITIRWMDNLKEIGFKPLYYTLRPELADIFNRCGYETIGPEDLKNVPTDSLWTYAMQTPLWLEVRPEEVVRTNYLWPSNETRNKWSFLKSSKKLKIGIRWQGNSKNERDLHRKVPLDVIMPKLRELLKDRYPNEVEFYSLQIGDGSEETVKYPELIDVTSMIKTYDDTLALIENLDYVITSCTSVLHGAAIVGTKTLGLIPISAYFTYLSPPTPGRPEYTSIWYGDNLRVFKQVKPKNWDQPLKQMGEFLLQDLKK